MTEEFNARDMVRETETLPRHLGVVRLVQPHEAIRFSEGKCQAVIHSIHTIYAENRFPTTELPMHVSHPIDAKIGKLRGRDGFRIVEIQQRIMNCFIPSTILLAKQLLNGRTSTKLILVTPSKGFFHIINTFPSLIL